MDAAACRVIYIDDRFRAERWLSREGVTAPTATQRKPSQDISELPPELQANVRAILSVFSQVFVCNSGRSFSVKLSELHDLVKVDCTPIIALFDVGSENPDDQQHRRRNRFLPSMDSPVSPPSSPRAHLRRQITFSSEADESYGLQLLSRIAADLQVDEGAKLIIPVAIVQPKRKDSTPTSTHASQPADDSQEHESPIINPQMMLHCLDAGALDVVQSPLDKAGIMGLTVHAYRIYKAATKEQASFLSQARTRRKQSWVGVDEEEKPYAYMREAMVKKLLKAICEPETVIEDYQHRYLDIEDKRKEVIASEVGSWAFCGHDFTEDELVYAGFCMLNHALQLPELETWRIPEEQLLHFMQGCRVAYNSFVLYHNFRHAVDVLQSLFYFIVQIGLLPPYPVGSAPPPFANNKSPIAKLLQPFDALTLLISAIGHDVGHPGVNNMFLVKLNAPLAQLYNDQSVLEAFHCAAYSQILRRHWPAAFNDKAVRKLMISSILATDMGVHSDYIQQLGNLQEKIHESKTTDSWSPKDRETYRVLVCGLLIKCADISNVARPWAVAEKWTHLLQLEFAHQGEMENAVGMETVLFGGPPEIGNILKLANSQIGFMTIFAHPLFQNVTDIIPAMGFAAAEILTNKGVWFTKAEQEKRKEQLRRDSDLGDSGAISPRSQSPAAPSRKRLTTQRLPIEEKAATNHFATSPLKNVAEPPIQENTDNSYVVPHFQSISEGQPTTAEGSLPGSPPKTTTQANTIDTGMGNSPTSPKSSGALSEQHSKAHPQAAPLQAETPSNALPTSRLQLGEHGPYETASTNRTSSENESPRQSRSQTVGSLPGGVSERDVDFRRYNGSHDTETSASDVGPLRSSSPSYATASPPPFTFATSSPSEPTRTFHPSAHNQVTSHAERASEPSLEHVNNDRTSFTTSGPATTGTTDMGSRANVGALSPSTEATSMLSAGSDDEQKTLQPEHHELDHNGASPDFDARRARAASAPSKAAFSLSSRESSKQDVRTTVLGQENGVVRPKGGTMSRKRSRLRLAFWKKRSESEE